MIERSSNKTPSKRPKRSALTSQPQDEPKKSLLHGHKTTIRTTNCFGDVNKLISPKHSGEEKSDEFVRNLVSNFPEKIHLNKAINKAANRKALISDSPDNENSQKNLTKINNNPKENDYLKKIIHSAPKKSERNLQIKKKSSGSFGRIRDQSIKHHQSKYFSKPERLVMLKRTKGQGENSRLIADNKKRTPSYCNAEAVLKEPANKTVKPKRRKPSEIPLRKSRIDGSSRKPKPVSMLLKRTVKEEESSFDLYSEKKAFTPVDEVSLCSELQITIDAIPDSENLNRFCTKPPRFLTQENVISFELERSSKHPNIFKDFLEVKPSTEGMKKLDLEKVKTSSFTVLQSDPSVLNRLESLHKQNVSSKKKVDAVNQKKSKSLNPKEFITCLKKRSSRRSLSPLTGIKNKSSSRIKFKKSKNQVQEKVTTPELTEADWKILSEYLSGKKLNSIPNHNETNTNKISKLNLSKKEISKSLREKLARWDQNFLQIHNPMEKEESKIPTPKKRVQSYDFGYKQSQDSSILESSKSALFSNRVTNSKKVECFGYSKSKITTPVILPSPLPTSPSLPPPLLLLLPVPDQNEKSSKCKNDDVKISESEGGKIVIENPQGKRTGSEKEKHALEGRTLKSENEQSSEKINSKGKVKVELKIDLNLEAEAEENFKNMQSCDCLFKNDIIEPDMELPKLNKVESSLTVLPDLLSSSEKLKVTEKLEHSDPFSNLTENDSVLEENFKSDSYLKENFVDKMSTSKIKEERKNNRSDAGDRRLPPLNNFCSSNFPLQGKIKADQKARNSLKKSYNKEGQKEVFEEESFMKLKRRNSEPNSHSGYIWKRSNLPIFRGHKPSVSSLASSLKHLNTDDFDDFIFWEPVPQKKTSSWEISLYQLKKTWSVLSCSVFKENRLPNTPGFVLESLRNGGTLSKGFITPHGGNNEIVSCAKENSFDVEPSIAQKNIDIRNWLAALNFPNSSSNSPNIISEGNFTAQPIVDSENLNISRVTPKRRKVLRNLKFPDKTFRIVTKDKNPYGRIIRSSKEDLKSAAREKSGGFVISDRFSKSAEEKSIFSKTKDRNTSSESEVLRKPEVTCEFETAETGTMVDEAFTQSGQSDESDEHQQSNIVKKSNFCKIPKENSFSIFDTLVMFVLFIMVISFILLIIYPIVSVDYI